MLRTLYLDMDGVMAGFDKYVKPKLGRSVGQNPGEKDITEGEWTWLRETHPHLFGELPVCDGAFEFAQYLRENYMYVKDMQYVAHPGAFVVEFLTAIPRSASFKYACTDKIMWCGQNFPDFPVCIGPYAKDKMKLSKVGDILIDDRVDNVEQWAAMGGQAIYHERETLFDLTKEALEDATSHTFPGVWKKGKRV